MFQGIASNPFQNENSGDWFNDDSNLSMKSADFNTLPLPDLSRSFDSMLDKSQSGIPGMLGKLNVASRSGGSIFSRDASSLSRKRRLEDDDGEDSQPNKKMRTEDQTGPIGFHDLLKCEKKNIPNLSIQKSEKLSNQTKPPTSSPLFNHSVSSVPNFHFDKSGSIEMLVDPTLNVLMNSAPIEERVSLPKNCSPFSLFSPKTKDKPSPPATVRSYAQILKETQNGLDAKAFNFSLLHKTLAEPFSSTKRENENPFNISPKREPNQPSWCQIVLGSKNVASSASTSEGTPSASDSASGGMMSPSTMEMITTDPMCLDEEINTTPIDAQSTDKEMDTTSTSTGSANDVGSAIGEKEAIEEKQKEDIITRPKIKPPPENSDKKKKEKRLRQINMGKDTREYKNYIRLIPKHKRKLGDPQTPDHTDLSVSKRRFAGIMRVWRRELHRWDTE